MGRTAGEEIGELGGKLSSPHDPERWQSPQRSPEKPWTCMCAHVQLQTGGLVAFKGNDTVGCIMYVGCLFNYATKTNMSSFKSGLCLFYCLYLTNPSVSCVSLTSAVPLALFIYLIRIDLIAL